MPNHSLEQAIDNALRASGKPFAVFDFDNTCIVNDIAEATLAYLCDRRLLRDLNLLGDKEDGAHYHERVFHAYHALSREGRYKVASMLCARMFSGFTPGEAEAVTLAAITEEGSRIGSKMLYDVHIERGLAVRPQILSLMQYLTSKRVLLWIVSAGAEPAARAAMRHFGIEGRLVGVRSALKNGMFTSELKIPLPIIEGKVECVKKFIDQKNAPLLAAGDSMNDLPLLEMAAIKVVVDRGNGLAALARERGWFVI